MRREGRRRKEGKGKNEKGWNDKQEVEGEKEGRREGGKEGRREGGEREGKVVNPKTKRSRDENDEEKEPKWR
jgi:hypothetical protein